MCDKPWAAQFTACFLWIPAYSCILPRQHPRTGSKHDSGTARDKKHKKVELCLKGYLFKAQNTECIQQKVDHGADDLTDKGSKVGNVPGISL